MSARGISGLELHLNVLNPRQQAQVLEHLDAYPWSTPKAGKLLSVVTPEQHQRDRTQQTLTSGDRLVQHYGYYYDYRTRKLKPAPEFPPILVSLVSLLPVPQIFQKDPKYQNCLSSPCVPDQCSDKVPSPCVSGQCSDKVPSPCVPDQYSDKVQKPCVPDQCSDKVQKPYWNQCIVNEYVSVKSPDGKTKKQGITWHTDDVHAFGEAIACVTLGDPAEMDFRIGGLVQTIEPPAGSVYIMTGESRWVAQHRMRPASTDSYRRRVSVTFRHVSPSDQE